MCRVKKQRWVFFCLCGSATQKIAKNNQVKGRENHIPNLRGSARSPTSMEHTTTTSSSVILKIMSRTIFFGILEAYNHQRTQGLDNSLITLKLELFLYTILIKISKKLYIFFTWKIKKRMRNSKNERCYKEIIGERKRKQKELIK